MSDCNHKTHESCLRADECAECLREGAKAHSPHRPGSVNVPKELFDWLFEYALHLRGAWYWKVNSTHRNCETMTKLDNHIKQAIALRDSPNDRIGDPAKRRVD